MEGSLCKRGAEVLHFVRSKVYDKENGEGIYKSECAQ